MCTIARFIGTIMKRYEICEADFGIMEIIRATETWQQAGAYYAWI